MTEGIDCREAELLVNKFINNSLIGDELWDLIGGEGTYQLFISEINKLGAHYKERIYREFLGIEPPEGFDKATLR